MDVKEPDLAGTYTYADYLTWEWEQRAELILGKIFKMSPAPSHSHQLILGNIHGLLWNYFRGKSCQAFLAPFDVRLPGPSRKKGDEDIVTVVQPDLCVICDPSKIDVRGCIGAPDWVVEILSRHTSAKDLTIKFDIYEAAAVKEYWVVDPEKKSVLVFGLNDAGKYAGSTGPFVETDTISPKLFPYLKIDLGIVFGG
ncbi:MAG TPA: Uma2 family endonuclease [Cyclobacteriaceae bacterium]|nr:Uma2 family endonuclease [Cyclobacteriaceae bacterium]